MSKLLAAVDKSGSFRVHLSIATDICEEARRVHNTSPTASAALGRVLVGTALMSNMLKEPEHRLTLQIKGAGPARQILAAATGDGSIKGYIADPGADMALKNGKLDVGGLIGKGELVVIRDIGLGEPYSGTIELVSGEIAEDLAAYYYISEQQNTSVALGVKVAPEGHIMMASGMLLQMLPGAEEDVISLLEKQLGLMGQITTIAEQATLAAYDKSEEGVLEELKNEIFQDLPGEYAVQTLKISDVRWCCDCSRERMGKALATIGKEDLRQIIDEDGKAELVCHFCNSKYAFSRDELEEIYASI